VNDWCEQNHTKFNDEFKDFANHFFFFLIEILIFDYMEHIIILLYLKKLLQIIFFFFLWCFNIINVIFNLLKINCQCKKIN
jgi:hypothetical protein